ncbi:hypothetical protein [Vibrio vulnificus]|uniref:hypothetical protein n=1 Tax=Vibrio vulnificus TaxID=672 RepID=UPI001A31A17B|nr:hypothetical protein [Vibrio vulnificus]MDS1873120.1 hypothetical protein [Vibrio vulnificus]HAS6391814.1 hypothetical protein [Vibrio vulnificus]HAS6424921.1 hypothetical protein [Vibrio vulnificus]
MSLNDITHPILYSAMTTLAYNINKKYYKDLHYMWCTPYFGSDFDSPHFTVPPSSSPIEIYNTLKKEVEGADHHNTKIELNRMGIRKGASIMLQLGKITQDQHDEIVYITKNAKDQHFKPLLCVISRIEAAPFYQKVDVKDRANPLSHEYILSDLPQSAFDIIRID